MQPSGITISKIYDENTNDVVPQTNLMRMEMLQQPCNTLLDHLTNLAKTVYGKIFPSRTHGQKTIIIEGNIGAGKTSLANWMRHNNNYLVILEPLERWQDLNGFNLLEAHYNDQENGP